MKAPKRDGLKSKTDVNYLWSFLLFQETEQLLDNCYIVEKERGDKVGDEMVKWEKKCI